MNRVEFLPSDHSRGVLRRIGFLVVLCSAGSVRAQSENPTRFAAGDVTRGWQTFHTKNCADCHAIWDDGATVGPDLGRIRTGRLTAGQLAGVMWNHIPRMLGQMEQTGHAPTTLLNQDMTDLFALIFFVRQLDELGDPIRGAEILRDKGCSECHETGAGGGQVGPDLAKWGSFANPIIWAQLMWEHAPMMEDAMRRSNVTWPKLEGSDLVHIVAYVRSIGGSSDRHYLHPGSVLRGRSLFVEKQCKSCHEGRAPDLATVDLPASAGALASQMWNHSPSMIQRMSEEGLVRAAIGPQQLADIIAYVLALRQVDQGGDADRGQAVFVEKGCVQCHDGDEITEQGAAPSLHDLSGAANPVDMASAMWNHGETMLSRMVEAGLPWPVFRDNEMVDLLAYLGRVQSSPRTRGNEGG